MASYKIGEKVIYYVNTNDFLYKIAKEFYFSDIKLFNTVLAKSEEDKINAIHVDLLNKTTKCYIKTGKDFIGDWKVIIDALKEKYKKDESSVDEIIAVINSNEISERELLLEFRKKVRAINPKTNLGKVLSYAPIDENGYSEKIYFNTFNEAHHDIVPNNGIKWKRQVERYLKIKTFKEGNKTVAFQFIGFNFEYGHKNRYIRSDIKKIISQQRCAHCNVKSNIEVDHKNGRYDDKSALNSITQDLSDFQPLCHKCNKLKRSSCKKCKENEVRYDASFLGYNVTVTKGDLKYCESINCNGCYWFDPIDFKSRLILNTN